ncbi:MAG: hypothetical protein ABI690_20675 [Chloroflexota bacterium]
MSHTTKPGNPDSEPEIDEEQADAVTGRRTVPLRVILLGVIALLLAVFIGTQVLGVLYVIVFPPAPPLPGDLTLMSHTNTDYGVDDWLYDSRQKPCDIVTYYTNSGGQCRLALFQCGNTQANSTSENDQPLPGDNVARCVGESKISIFAMRWQANIATGPSADVPTEFRISREIYWTGAAPPIPQPVSP